MKKLSYSKKEITQSIEAAKEKAKNSRGKQIPDVKLKRLREYAEAMVEIPLEHVKEGLLSAEDLVFSIIAAAEFVQRGFVVRKSL